MNRTRIHWLIGDCLPDHVALLEAVPGVGNVGKLIVDALVKSILPALLQGSYIQICHLILLWMTKVC